MAAEDDNSNRIHTACTVNNITACIVNNAKNSARLKTIDSQNPYIATHVTEVQVQPPDAPRGGKQIPWEPPEKVQEEVRVQPQPPHEVQVQPPNAPRGGKSTIQIPREPPEKIQKEVTVQQQVPQLLHEVQVQPPDAPRDGKSTIQQIPEATADVDGILNPHIPRGGKNHVPQSEAAADVDGTLHPHLPRGGKSTIQQIPEAAADVDGILHPHVPRGGKSNIQQIPEAAANVNGILHPHVPMAVKVLYNKFMRPQPMSMVSYILMYPVAVKVLVIQQISEAAADVTP